MADNKKGIIRMVMVTTGPFPESCYIDEILAVENPETNQWEEVTMTTAHTKQLMHIRVLGF